MSPNCVWLVIVGGCKGFDMKQQISITDTDRLIMIVELGKIMYYVYVYDYVFSLFQYIGKLVSGQ